jgi:ATP-binding cassette, subfamily B, bacterial MsbA
MKQFFALFKYIRIPSNKLALYILFTLLATVFSLLSVGMISPFLSLIFKADNEQATLGAKSIGPLKDYFEQVINTRGKLFGLGLICIVIVLAALLKNCFLFLSYYISTPVRNGILSDFRVRLYRKILDLPLGFFTEQRKGDLLNRMVGDIAEIQGSIVTALEGLIKDPLTILFFLGYMIYISPALSVFLLVLLPITAVIIGRISKKLKRQSSQWSVANGENLSHVEETLGGIKVIKAFGAEQQMDRKFLQTNSRMIGILNQMNLRRDLSSPLTEVLGIVVLCIILYAGGRLVFGGSGLSGDDLLPFIISFAMMINPAKTLSTSISNIQRGMGAVERIEEILQAPVVVADAADAQPMPAFSQQVVFDKVCFGYQDVPVLHNISFTLQKGKTLALVGSSGAGKSTIADLLPRFHDVSSGSITIDGTNIKACTISSLRSQMSFVTQEPILFNDTIAANIALGNETATAAQIEAAAKVANAHSFIIQKENGYQTNIGDRGMKLSGGERQRLTIARAVLSNPAILILDEATSSLDTESEKLVQEAIANLMKERTSLVIAHRLSTISNADEIVVLQKGEIIEQGNHDTLMANNGFYKKLVEMQEIK